jgi:hypothetical protein
MSAFPPLVGRSGQSVNDGLREARAVLAHLRELALAVPWRVALSSWAPQVRSDRRQ